MKNLVIFASGNGSNAREIIRYFNDNITLARVVAIFCNRARAGVVEIAKEAGLPCIVFDKAQLVEGQIYGRLAAFNPDLIILAGFLLQIPHEMIVRYPNRIINIHPALLPKFGGKGMYGSRVHEAVLEAQEIESGITVHYVDEHYDEGDIIAQERCEVLPGDTAVTVASKVQQLEHYHYPRIIESLL